MSCLTSFLYYYKIIAIQSIAVSPFRVAGPCRKRGAIGKDLRSCTALAVCWKPVLSYPTSIRALPLLANVHCIVFCLTKSITTSLVRRKWVLQSMQELLGPQNVWIRKVAWVMVDSNLDTQHRQCWHGYTGEDRYCPPPEPSENLFHCCHMAWRILIDCFPLRRAISSNDGV